MRGEVLRESLGSRRRSLAWWCFTITGLTALTLAFYPSIEDSGALSNYTKDLPESMRALFAGGEFDLTSGPGYLNSQLYALMAPGLMLVFAIGAGARAIAGDEEDGTLDLLLAQPVSRTQVVLERTLAIAVSITVLSIVFLGVVAGGSAAFGLEIGFGKLVAATGGVWLLGIAFGALALAAGSLRPGRGRAIGIVAGIAVLSWLLDGLAQVVGFLEPWRDLSPVYQAVGRSPLREGIPISGWLMLAGLTAAATAVAVAGLNRRDVEQ